MTEPDEVSVHVVENDDRRWWPIVVSVGSAVMSAVLSTTLCLTVSERNARHGREQRIELQESQARQHAALCALIVSLDDNYRSNPLPTELSKKNAQSVADQRALQGCPPREE